MPHQQNNKKLDEISVTNREKTFQDVFFNASTSKITQALLSNLNEDDTNSFAQLSVDPHRVTKINQLATDKNFKIKLFSEILDVLQDKQYAGKLSISRNPSGFLRLNNDLISLVKDKKLVQQIPDIGELRLNFWPGDLYQNLGAKLEPETQHTHPRGFCSFLVTGGYIHNLYLPSDKTNNSKTYTHTVHVVEGSDKVKHFNQPYLVKMLQEPQIENFEKTKKSQYIIAYNNVWYFNSIEKSLTKLKFLEEKSYPLHITG